MPRRNREISRRRNDTGASMGFCFRGVFGIGGPGFVIYISARWIYREWMA